MKHLQARGITEPNAREMADAVLERDPEAAAEALEAELADLEDEVERLTDRLDEVREHAPAGQVQRVESMIDGLRQQREPIEADIEEVRNLEPDELIDWARAGDADQEVSS